MKAKIETKLTLTGIAVTATWFFMSSVFGTGIVTEQSQPENDDFEFIAGASYAISDCPEVINPEELCVYEPHSWFAENGQNLLHLLRH